MMILQYESDIDGGVAMHAVNESPEYQIVIPKNFREAMWLRPGLKIRFIEYEGRTELDPDRNISELKGFLKGINTEFIREDYR